MRCGGVCGTVDLCGGSIAGSRLSQRAAPSAPHRCRGTRALPARLIATSPLQISRQFSPLSAAVFSPSRRSTRAPRRPASLRCTPLYSALRFGAIPGPEPRKRVNKRTNDRGETNDVYYRLFFSLHFFLSSFFLRQLLFFYTIFRRPSLRGR